MSYDIIPRSYDILFSGGFEFQWSYDILIPGVREYVEYYPCRTLGGSAEIKVEGDHGGHGARLSAAGGRFRLIINRSWMMEQRRTYTKLLPVYHLPHI